jgi:hypothetical protein
MKVSHAVPQPVYPGFAVFLACQSSLSLSCCWTNNMRRRFSLTTLWGGTKICNQFFIGAAGPAKWTAMVRPPLNGFFFLKWASSDTLSNRENKPLFRRHVMNKTEIKKVSTQNPLAFAY